MGRFTFIGALPTLKLVGAWHQRTYFPRSQIDLKHFGPSVRIRLRIPNAGMV